MLSIGAMARNTKVFTWDAMAYYQFDLNIGILADSFRYVNAQVVESSINTKSPVLYIDEGSKLVCSSLDINPLQVLPYIDPGLTTTLKLPNFDYNQKQYSYTLSMWFKSSGSHAFSETNQESSSFFKLEKVMALWFNSPSSFRVYIYADKNYQEVVTGSVSIPVR